MIIPMKPFGDWIKKICPLLEAIYDAIKYRTIHSESRYLMADEIPYTIVKNPEETGSSSDLVVMLVIHN